MQTRGRVPAAPFKSSHGVSRGRRGRSREMARTWCRGPPPGPAAGAPRAISRRRRAQSRETARPRAPGARRVPRNGHLAPSRTAAARDHARRPGPGPGAPRNTHLAPSRTAATRGLAWPRASGDLASRRARSPAPGQSREISASRHLASPPAVIPRASSRDLPRRAVLVRSREMAAGCVVCRYVRGSEVITRQGECQ